jgi:hypothetical protein
MNSVSLFYRAANSMVEYSAFNRFVPGSIPGQPNKNLQYSNSQINV